MHMKKAVIFDLDGTLANTLTSLAYCTNRALEDFGLQAIPQECYKKFVGNGARMQIHGDRVSIVPVLWNPNSTTSQVKSRLQKMPQAWINAKGLLFVA